MSPVLLYNLVIVLIATFQYFTQAYTMTNGRGDPNNATLFINLELFREASCSTGWATARRSPGCCSSIVLVLTLAAVRVRPQARLLRRRRAMTRRRADDAAQRAFARPRARSPGSTAGSWPRRR